MWTSLGAKPVAALTETQTRREGARSSQLFWSSLATIASISAIVWFTRSTPPFSLGW